MKPGFHLIDARVETTWVPGAFQLWVRGSKRARPHLVHPLVAVGVRGVAVQVDPFEKRKF